MKKNKRRTIVKDKEIIYAPEYVAERNRKYDEIAGVAYVNIFTLSKNSDVIAIAPFDPKDKEHLFVLNVAKGVGGIVEKNVAVDVSKWQLRRLNRGLDKECQYEKLNGRFAYAINPTILLNDMREWAETLTEDNDFTFGKIFDEFYAKQKGKRK